MAIAAREGEIQVSLRFAFDYPVKFTRDALEPANPDLLETLRRRERFSRHRVLFILDEPAARRRAAQAGSYADVHKGTLTLAAPVLVASSQALSRRPDSAAWLRARIAAAKLGERCHVVAVGGEDLQETAGFAVATLRPSPRLTRIATQPIGQIRWCGASVSAPEGADYEGHPAAFGAAFAVLNDRLWLDDAAPEHRRPAIVEAARLALSQDAEFFHWLAERAGSLQAADAQTLECLVRWAARLALSPPVSFGRWSVGKLAALSVRRRGAARAASLALDCSLSALLCGLPTEAARAALELLRACGATFWDPGWGKADRVADALAEQAAQGLVLLASIGQLREPGPIGPSSLAAAARWLRRSIGNRGGGRR